MVKFLRKSHTVLYLFSVLFCFILFFPFLYFFTRNPKRYYKQIVFCRKWLSVISAYAVGIRFVVEYDTSIDWSKNYVICPNHTSILDITSITYLCPHPFSFMGKIELLKNPVTRTFFKSIDIAVDRSSRISSFKAFKQADSILKEDKSLVIFPEGKIDDEYPPRLQAFKSGSFRLALENQVEILPVVILDAWRILWDDGHQHGSKPGKVHIKVLKPISTTNLSEVEVESLQDKVFTTMQDQWLKYNKNTNILQK